MIQAYDPAVVAASLRRWWEQPIPATEKGFTALDGVTAEQLAARGTRVPDGALTLPIMTLRDSALRSNIATMAAWCRDHVVELAPHGKTTTSPQLTARQLEAGAWGITAATIQQVRVFAQMGVRRILLANQLVDPVAIHALASALDAEPALTVIGYVDSVASVEILDREWDKAGATRPLPVVVELGLSGYRSGARDENAAIEVARAAAATHTLDVVGASGYEGVLGHERTEQVLRRASDFCADIRRLGLRMASEGVLRGELSANGTAPLLTAGGSTYFDVVARDLVGPEPATVVIRSGGSVTHDDVLYANATPLPVGDGGLEPALDAWAHVTSRPERETVLVAAGKRDVPYDVAMPLVRRAQAPNGTPRNVADVSVTKLNDQHGFLSVPSECDLEVGDLVCFGLAHPCTAFDKWRLIPIIDDDRRVVDVAYTQF